MPTKLKCILMVGYQTSVRWRHIALWPLKSRQLDSLLEGLVRLTTKKRSEFNTTGPVCVDNHRWRVVRIMFPCKISSCFLKTSYLGTIATSYFPILFVDDTNPFIQDMFSLQVTLKQELTNSEKCLKVKKLSLNRKDHVHDFHTQENTTCRRKILN